ncbi:MAG: hypothetical protein JRJ49_00340 [Deltaproteobacteria bacterium]|nr:hypothetical protein [Deltaproteobacteria bacterium]
MANNKKTFQLIWGTAFFLSGIGVFIRIPQVMPQIESIKHFSSVLPFIKICFYLMGLILTAGGGKKIYLYFKK